MIMQQVGYSIVAGFSGCEVGFSNFNCLFSRLHWFDSTHYLIAINQTDRHNLPVSYGE